MSNPSELKGSTKGLYYEESLGMDYGYISFQGRYLLRWSKWEGYSSDGVSHAHEASLVCPMEYLT